MEKNDNPAPLIKIVFLPFVLASLFHIGAITNSENVRLISVLTTFGLFFAIAWRLDRQKIILQKTWIGMGLGSGSIFGLILGMTKLIVWKKFYSIFLLITNPILFGMIGAALMMVFFHTFHHYPSIKSFFKKWFPKNHYDKPTNKNI